MLKKTIAITSSVFVLCSTLFSSKGYASTVTDFTINESYTENNNTLSDLTTGVKYSAIESEIFESPGDTICVGYYNPGDEINVILNDGTWCQTNKGYIKSGVLCESYDKTYNITADSDESYKYIGKAYEVLNALEDKYYRILQQYEICLSDDISKYYEASLTENNVAAGLTVFESDETADTRKMYILDNESMLTGTIYHELGHALDFEEEYQNLTSFSSSQEMQISFQTEKEVLKEKYSLEDINISTIEEYFAEVFRLSLEDEAGLEKTAPIASSYIKTINTQIENLKTYDEIQKLKSAGLIKYS